MKFLVEKITESHEQNKDWERAYHSLEKDYQALSERYEILRKMAFGVHSEKTKTIFNPDQTLLFNEAELAAGTRHVFDTANFTVKGKALNSYKADVDSDADFTPDTEVIKDGYFHESEFRSAPYFDIQIDGINLLDTKF